MFVACTNRPKTAEMVNMHVVRGGVACKCVHVWEVYMCVYIEFYICLCDQKQLICTLVTINRHKSYVYCLLLRDSTRLLIITAPTCPQIIGMCVVMPTGFSAHRICVLWNSI